MGFKRVEIEPIVDLRRDGMPLGFPNDDDVIKLYYFPVEVEAQAFEAARSSGRGTVYTLDNARDNAQDRLDTEFNETNLGALCHGLKPGKRCGMIHPEDGTTVHIRTSGTSSRLEEPGRIWLDASCSTCLIPADEVVQQPPKISHARQDRLADHLCLEKMDIAAQRLAQLFLEELGMKQPELIRRFHDEAGEEIGCGEDDCSIGYYNFTEQICPLVERSVPACLHCNFSGNLDSVFNPSEPKYTPDAPQNYKTAAARVLMYSERNVESGAFELLLQQRPETAQMIRTYSRMGPTATT